ncbi:MAG: cellulase family glycosylhydrolase, partial [Ruminococcus sp.]
TEGKAESYGLVNEINQKFVDVIRTSGGNNPERHLLISGYNTGIDRTCDPLFKMPNDPANRMAVSVHYYTPAGFAILEDEDASWAKARSTWGTEDDFNELYSQMDMMKTNFIDKGVPVIIGEYGCPTKGKEPESVRLFLSSVCKAAYERQLCPVLWSITDVHYNRNTCKLNDQELKVLFNEICDSSKKQPQSITGDINGDGSFTVSDIVLLQKWLISEDNTEPLDCDAADINKDNRINIFDLSLLKEEFIKSIVQ